MEGSFAFKLLVLILFSFGVVCYTSEEQIGLKTDVSSVVSYRDIHHVKASDDFNFGNFTKPYTDFIDSIFNRLRESENITQQCQSATQLLFQLAAQDNKFALKVLDATGKLSSGILEGGIAFPGFFSECLSVTPVIGDSGNPSFPLYGQYCSITVQLSPTSRHKDIPEVVWDILTKSQKPLFIGLCVPSSCSLEDIRSSSNAVATVAFNGSSSSVGSCHIRNEHTFSSDTAAIVFACFLGVYLTFVVFASVFDAFCPLTETSERLHLISSHEVNNGCPDVKHSIQPDDTSRKRDYSLTTRGHEHSDSANSESFSEYQKEDIRSTPASSESQEVLCEKKQAPSSRRIFFRKCIAAFSLKKSAHIIFSVRKASSGIITSLDGIRLFSMMLIIAGHTYSFGLLNLFIRNPSVASEAPKNGVIFHAFSNGTLTVDSFYFLSGTLTAFLTMKILSKSNGKLNFAQFYLHRFIRLTPLLMIVIAICALLLRHVGDGPNWISSITMFDVWCEKNWWTNLLYLQNFIDTENMCLSHSWYLATDMQFALVTPFILLVLNRKFLYGAILLLFLFITSAVVTLVITWINDYPAIPYMNALVTQEKMNAYYKNVYIKPYCRIGPYLVGLALGYFFFRYKELNLSKAKVISLWCASVVLAIVVVFGMWPATEGKLPSTASAAFYGSLARSAWAVFLAWLVAACFYGYGGFVNNILSWPPLEPFSKLTYSAYLIHPVVMNVYYGMMETAVQFSGSFMLYMVISNMVVTYMLSFVLSVLFEIPLINLEKVVTGKAH